MNHTFTKKYVEKGMVENVEKESNEQSKNILIAYCRISGRLRI